VQNLEEVAASVEQRIGETRKRIFDLQVQNEQPFENESRLSQLSRRQDEIEETLDLTKGQTAAQLDSEVADGSGVTDKVPTNGEEAAD
jgi:hypothetical protein